MSLPTNVEFANDGRVFVAEKRGTIKTFDNLSDTTPTTVADLRLKVYNAQDRGLLGLALDPNFPTNPYVYALYTYDAQIGGTAPTWNDVCPDPPGATTDGCVVSGRLSRLQIDPATNTMTGTEKVLIEDWCQQYPSHSIGDLAFGPDGALYVSGGEGASFTFTDYGQGGGSAGSPTPKNPCGDPPTGVGGTQTAPTAEGGRLRSQDLQTSGDPVTLDGALLRVDPATGAAMPGNPLYDDADPNARRIISYGHRNPFRFTIRPGTSEVWLGDVGGTNYDEINRIVDPTESVVDNFGWPCYEGAFRQPSFDNANLNICENLYKTPSAVTTPYFAYHRQEEVVAGDIEVGCAVGQTTISALAFYEGGTYPARYNDALFFADYSRGCMWVMMKGANGLPDPATIERFSTGVGAPVDLESGPNNDLFYADIGGGTIRHIEYTGSGTNRPPSAAATANPTNGPAPLTVDFDGTGSSDPDPGETLSYAWDLDGDGAYDDSTSPQPTHTYDTSGSYQVGLKVTDSQGLSDTLDQPLTIGVDTPANDPPTATINSPLASTTWKVGDIINFSGSASDPQDGALSASALSWELIVHHCTSPTTCHEHPDENYPGVDHGSFSAPDHEYPSHLELRLTATDSGGSKDTESVRLDPQSVELRFESDPAGLQLTFGEDAVTTPFSRTVIVGSTNSISAHSPQTLAGESYRFSSWSDAGAESHDIVAPSSTATYKATYKPTSCTITGTSKGETLTGTAGDDVICGGGGNDTLKGLGGNDVLKGEAHSDKLHGGTGDDILDGALGADWANFSGSLVGVTASLVDNTATGEGSDTLVMIDHLEGSNFADTLTGSDTSNNINGRSGNDSIFGRDGADKPSGMGGSDAVHGGPGNDTVVGGAAADSLYGEEGDDSVNSKDSVNGNDTLDGGAHVNGDTALTDATEKSIIGFP